jgi:hypothetical protein
MTNLSKSKLLLYRQCPKRLWLQVNKPDLINISATTQSKLDEGNKVGDIARQLNSPGLFIETLNRSEALELTQQALKDHQPIFEAAFCNSELLIRADLLLPENDSYRLVEVKSSTSVKDYHLDDITIQAWVMARSGLKPASVSLAFINNQFTYEGSNNYKDLLIEEDLSSYVEEHLESVPQWIEDAKKILSSTKEPIISIGDHCEIPFKCDFIEYCSPTDPEVEYPVEILPYGKNKAAQLRAKGYKDLRNVPVTELSNPRHIMVHAVTVSGEAVLDPRGGSQIKSLPYPRYYIDFETIAFAVPIWTGTRPYMQVPFQWSCHVELNNNDLKHFEFLDISGKDPRRDFAESLISATGTEGPVLVYNGGFESVRLKELASTFPDLSEALLAIIERFFDLLPFAREFYYHPDMKGSWSIKDVLPTIAPELDYSNLEVGDGLMAQEAYKKLILNEVSLEQKISIRNNLLNYCRHDTLAMTEIVKKFSERLNS